MEDIDFNNIIPDDDDFDEFFENEENCDVEEIFLSSEKKKMLKKMLEDDDCTKEDFFPKPFEIRMDERLELFFIDDPFEIENYLDELNSRHKNALRKYFFVSDSSIAEEEPFNYVVNLFVGGNLYQSLSFSIDAADESSDYICQAVLEAIKLFLEKNFDEMVSVQKENSKRANFLEEQADYKAIKFLYYYYSVIDENIKKLSYWLKKYSKVSVEGKRIFYKTIGRFKFHKPRTYVQKVRNSYRKSFTEENF